MRFVETFPDQHGVIVSAPAGHTGVMRNLAHQSLNAFVTPPYPTRRARASPVMRSMAGSAIAAPYVHQSGYVDLAGEFTCVNRIHRCDDLFHIPNPVCHAQLPSQG